MAIILDANELFQKTYNGYLQNSLFTSLAITMPNEAFLYPAQNGILPTANNMVGIHFPPKKGLFAQLKTNKWLKDNKASAIISFNRTFKVNGDLKQVCIFSDEGGFKDVRLFMNATDMGFTSDYLKNRFVEKYPEKELNTFLLDNIINEPISEITDCEAIKEQYTQGLEYFINVDFYLDKEKLIALLKGFSTFKKRQQSSWKLMIALRSVTSIKKAAAEEVLCNYKYRQDVVLCTDENLSEKIAAAHVLISLDEAEVFPVPIAEAIRQKTPVIGKRTFTTENKFDDMITYLPHNGNAAIGDALMQMYKAEKYRNDLITKMETISPLITVSAATAEFKRVLCK